MHPNEPQGERVIGGDGAEAIRLAATGKDAFSAKRTASSPAPEWITPPPRKRTGRRELLMRRAAAQTSDIRIWGSGSGLPGSGQRSNSTRLTLDVFGNVDEDRAGPSGRGDAKGFGKDLEQIAGGSHLEASFGDGKAQPERVHFLEGAGSEKGPRDLARDADEGDRIKPGIGDRRKDIGCPGPRGGETHLGQPRDTRHALGDESRPLLVAGQYMVKHIAS